MKCRQSTVIALLLLSVLSLGWVQEPVLQAEQFEYAQNAMIQPALQDESKLQSSFLITQNGGGNPWVIDGIVVFNHTAYGEVRVWPHTSRGLTRHEQYVNITSWINGNVSLDFAFEYDSAKTIPKRCYIWKNISHPVLVPEWGNKTVGNSTTVIEYNSTHFTQIAFDPTELPFTHLYEWQNTTGFYWNEWMILGFQEGDDWYYDWKDITAAFTHAINPLNGRDLQWIKNVYFEKDQTRQLKFLYKTPLEVSWGGIKEDYDIIGPVSGKWGLWVKRSVDTITVAKTTGRFVHLDPWWDSNYSYRKNITTQYDQVAATLTDFPMLVSITDSDLASDAQEDGDDIAFVDSAGNQLDHELEFFNGTSGVLVAWVRIPSLSSSSNTTLSMYYGYAEASNQENATGVWDGEYEAVWHLDENATGTGTSDTYTDSTSNIRHGDDYVSATGETGKIGDGQQFDGSDDYIIATGWTGLLGAPNMTCSAWIQVSTAQDGGIVGWGIYDKWNMRLDQNSGANWGLLAETRSGYERYATSLNDGEWHYVAVTFDNPTDILNATGYVDGSEDSVNAQDDRPLDFGADDDVQIGKCAVDTNRIWNGYIDELRISSIARSANWIATEYNNQNTPSSFYAVGSEEEAPSGDETAPSFTYDGTSTTNNTNVELGTSILVNWSITEANPSKYIIYSNETGTGNISRVSGAYSNGDYKNWTFANTNTSNIGHTLFFQVWANDTSANSNSSIVYFDIVDTTDPVLTYDGTSTTNNSNVEINTAILANWSLTDLDPDTYTIYCNASGTNSSVQSGSWSTGDYKSYTEGNTNISNIGNTIFIQLVALDSTGNRASEVAYFNIVDNTAPVLSYTGTTNNSEVEYGTAITYNSSLTDLAPHMYEFFSNHSATNSSVASGTWNSDDYKSWQYANTNCSNVNNVVFIQITGNDTSNNRATETAYFTIINTAPAVSYTGLANQSNVEWETEQISVSWSVTENTPDTYILYWNQTGSNTTRASGSYSGTIENTYTPVLADIGNIIWFQLVVNDTCGLTGSRSVVYFTITNTAAPTVSISSPANTTYTGNITVTLACANGDLDTLWYEIYYSNGTQHTANTTWTISVELSLSDASYYLIGYANDTAGLEDSETVYFTISTTLPPSGSTGYQRVRDKLMEPLFPTVNYPLLGLLFSAVAGLVLQYSQADPRTQQQQQRRQLYILGLLTVIFYVVLRVIDAISLLQRVISFELPSIDYPVIFDTLWDGMIQPSLLGWPLGGILLFAVLGLYQSANYHPTDPQRQTLKRGFLALCGGVLLFSILQLVNVSQIVNAFRGQELTWPTIEIPTVLADLEAVIMQPAFPFTPLTVPILSVLIVASLAAYTLLVTRPPRTEPRRKLRTVVALLVWGAFAYVFVIMGDLAPLLDEGVTWIIELYS